MAHKKSSYCTVYPVFYDYNKPVWIKKSNQMFAG